jgi:hypothetical protein
MPQRKTKRRNLLRHQANLERSLRDFREGKKAGHLAEDELTLLITGLEARLLALGDALAATGCDNGDS